MSNPYVNSPERFWQLVPAADPSECWLWRGTTLDNGYGQFSVNKKRVQAHRFAWIDTHGPIPDGLCVCHRCDVPKCVNPSHLFLGTTTDNIRDASAKGRLHRPIGEKHPGSILTDDMVVQMRRLRASGVSVSEIAARFGVRLSTASGVIRGRSWRHVSERPVFAFTLAERALA